VALAEGQGVHLIEPQKHPPSHALLVDALSLAQSPEFGCLNSVSLFCRS
jgi:hypothetical protein